ncbi:MAG: DUF3413 domain-containing protein [Gammaproteobacteria bacterium]|nr:DUF3413 domain-containing protein [Gammaproteobacteria bacterium]MBU1553641.1 DUF3413 domain-containing protein [Gammaproteobacteria bacterium]MBU2070168.1 DUF3413 domain-containing protein [Gammaproteobacteria bacterium]MBU2183581.1 DUF3413 domain-containing protein [Gammaproteobacteria bacterium]MBU2204732.1 DUF3413 domain-containing protein [Gammaproteobacteria bacterium]
MVLENNLSLVKKVNRLLNWGHWFSFFNILLALTVTAVYWLAEPMPQTLVGVLYLILNWLGHTAFLCFMFFILTIFPVSLIFPYQRHVRGLAATIASLAFIVLIFDAYVYASLGYHVGSASYDQAIDLLRQQIVTNLRNFVLIVVSVGAVLLAVQLTLSNYCWKKVERLKQSGIAKPLLWLFIGSFMLSHLLHIYADANFNYDVTKQDNVLPLSYPATAKTLLARHQLVDLTNRSQLQLDTLLLNDTANAGQLAQCTKAVGPATALIVVERLSEQQQQWLSAANLKPLPQHFAPNNNEEALLNLLYGKFYADAASAAVLSSSPAWLAQLSTDLVSVTAAAGTTNGQLPWLTEQAAARFAIIFDNQPEQHWQQYQQYPQLVVLSLTSAHTKFSLAPAAVWSNWAALRQLQPHQVTQHLDWLPTLLAQAGCAANGQWLGDNLLHPKALPKLNISGDTVISFKKDKMVLLHADGSYGVWSAGTLLPLNDKLDLPMLIDALKRIEQPKVE